MAVADTVAGGAGGDPIKTSERLMYFVDESVKRSVFSATLIKMLIKE